MEQQKKNRSQDAAKPAAAPPAKSHPFDTFAILLFVFGSGAVLMALEILGSRILAPNFNNTIFTWGSLITVVLAALSLGYMIGGRVADRFPSVRLLAMIGFASALAILIVPQFGLAISDAVRAWDPGPRANPLIVSVLLFFLPSTLMGMVSPFAVKLRGKTLASIGAAAGTLYALSTAGSITGTLLTTFVLIPAIGVQSIEYCLVATLAALSLLLLARSFLTRGNVSTATVVTGTVAAILVGVLGIGLAATKSGYAASPAAKVGHVIYYTESPYHNVSVVDVDKKRYLCFGKQFESGIRLDDAPYYNTACDYTDMFSLVRLFTGKIEHVLFIGCGGGIGPRVFHRDLKNAQIDVVDIDPEVVDVCKKYFYVVEDDKLRFHVADGRFYLRNSEQKYDVIVLDAYSINGQVPFHLMTREFMQELKDHLTPDGAVIMNLISGLHREGALFNAERLTFQDVFGDLHCFPRDYLKYPKEEGPRNIMLVATNNGRQLTAQEITSRAIALHNSEEISISMNNYWQFVGDFAGDLPSPTGKMLTDDYAPVEVLQQLAY
jgi:spermidine synthase